MNAIKRTAGIARFGIALSALFLGSRCSLFGQGPNASADWRPAGAVGQANLPAPETKNAAALQVEFEGNAFVSSGRLRTLIHASPNSKGEIDAKSVDEDVRRVESFYRSLGFKNVHVDRKIRRGQGRRRRLLFRIREGRRFRFARNANGR